MKLTQFWQGQTNNFWNLINDMLRFILLRTWCIVVWSARLNLLGSSTAEPPVPSELWLPANERDVTSRCRRSLFCFRFSISFCQTQLNWLAIFVDAFTIGFTFIWNNYKLVLCKIQSIRYIFTTAYLNICNNIIYALCTDQSVLSLTLWIALNDK